MNSVASCIEKGCGSSKKYAQNMILEGKPNSLSLSYDELVLNINTRSKKIITQRAQFPQDRRTPNSI